MNLILDLVLVSLSILMLWKGADWLVDAASEIAHSLKISDLVIGLTVVAFARGANLRPLASSGGDLLVSKAGLELDDAVLLILLCQPGKTFGAGAGRDRRGQEQHSNKDGEQ